MQVSDVKYKADDVDCQGNSFPALYVRHEEMEFKHIIELEYPVVVGLHTGDEIWESELGHMQRFQLPMVQSYAMFLEDRILIWDCFPPASVMSKPDQELLYSEIQDWKTL
jgi:hypothetical protein